VKMAASALLQPAVTRIINCRLPSPSDNKQMGKRSVRKSPPVCSLRLLAREAPPMRGMRVVIHVQGAESRVVVRQITAHAVDPIVSRSRR